MVFDCGPHHIVFASNLAPFTHTNAVFGISRIALKIDPEYSIVLSCYPYLSRRLLTDSSEHSRVLLRQMLYTDQGRLDVRRLQRLASGFRNYTTEPATPGTAPAATAGETLAPPSRRSSSRTGVAMAAASSSVAGANGAKVRAKRTMAQLRV